MQTCRKANLAPCMKIRTCEMIIGRWHSLLTIYIFIISGVISWWEHSRWPDLQAVVGSGQGALHGCWQLRSDLPHWHGCQDQGHHLGSSLPHRECLASFCGIWCFCLTWTSRPRSLFIRSCLNCLTWMWRPSHHVRGGLPIVSFLLPFIMFCVFVLLSSWSWVSCSFLSCLGFLSHVDVQTRSQCLSSLSHCVWRAPIYHLLYFCLVWMSRSWLQCWSSLFHCDCLAPL